MKVAIYCHSIAPSIDGVCRRFTALLTELVNQKHEIMLFTLEDSPEDLPPEITTVVTLDHMCFPAYPDKKVARPSFFVLWQMYSALNSFSPEILHVTADGYSHMFTLAGIALQIPVVASFHTDVLDLLSSHNAHPFQKGCVMFKEALDSVILDSCSTTSNSFAKKLAKQYVNVEHLIITSVDSNLFNPNKRNESLREQLMFGDPDGFLCVYVGRISKEKRLDIIIEALKHIPKAYLALVGDGPAAPQYKELHGKENRIYCDPKFLNHSELAEVYASSDIHVSASQFETLGNTVLEAFASGIPVVVPRTQGFCDTVHHEDDGFLFNAGESNNAKGGIIAMNRYILSLLNDRDLRIRMGKRGREDVANRTISRVVANLVEWYSTGIKNRANRSFIRCFLIMIPLCLAVPFAIVSLGCYDILMKIVAALGIELDVGESIVANDHGAVDTGSVTRVASELCMSLPVGSSMESEQKEAEMVKTLTSQDAGDAPKDDAHPVSSTPKQTRRKVSKAIPAAQSPGMITRSKSPKKSV